MLVIYMYIHTNYDQDVYFSGFNTFLLAAIPLCLFGFVHVPK